MVFEIVNIIFCKDSFPSGDHKMSYNPNFEQIGNALIQLYYSKFDVADGPTRAQGLLDLYDAEESIMTFEGSQVKGRQAILERFSVSF